MSINDLVKADSKSINGQIAAIRKMSANLSTKVHACAVSCVLHAMEHGDFTLLSKLVDALGTAARTNAVKAWALKHAGAKWKAGKDGKPGQFGVDTEVMAKLREQGNEAVKRKLVAINPFIENKEPEFDGLDIPKLIASIVSRAEKLKADAEKGDEGAIKRLAKSNLKGLAALRMVKADDVVPFEQGAAEIKAA